MPKDTFDAAVAATYDQRSASMFTPEILGPAVDVLNDLARGGAALEFGIGTGRVAIPLRTRGVPVHGIDLSDAMLAELRAKPDAASIAVTRGDFATTHVGRRFALVYLVFNTIMNLTTQDEQVACFQNAAAHLEPGGHFVVECMVPDLQRLPPGQDVVAFDVTPTHLGFDRYDIATQQAWSHHYYVDGDRVQTFTTPFRYVWPAELDLMARLAGMRLVDRWADWHRGRYTAEHRSHVTVWERPA